MVVSIRRDLTTGDVVPSEVPPLAEAFAALDAAGLPSDFLSEADRDQGPAGERLFAGE